MRVTLITFVLVAAILAAGCGGGSRPKPTPATTDTTAATTPSPQPARPTETATSPTTIALPMTVGGRPLTRLTVGEPIEFPDQMVMYVATSGCANCGFGAGDLWRIYRGHEGSLVADHSEPEGYAETYSLSADGGTIFAYVCDGYCGGEEFPSETASGQFAASRDGGITWQPLSDRTFPRTYAYFSGWLGDQLVTTMVKFLPSNRVERVDQFLLPSFQPLVPPGGLPPATPGEFQFPQPFIGPGGGLFWEMYQRTTPQSLFDEHGQPVTLPGLGTIVPGVEWRDQSLGQTGHQGISSVWVPIVSNIDSQRLFVEVDSKGTPVAGFTTNLAAVTFAARLSPTEWLGTAILPLDPGQEPGGNNNYHAVLIDTATGLMHPIHGLPGYPSPLPGNFSWPRLALTGTFWRVDAGGDCLNVRQEVSTSSASLGCFASGVLLREREGAALSGWKAVSTPDGRDGFAASEFLQ